MQHESRPPWIVWGALAAFVLAASTGALIRFGFRYGFPAGLNYLNIRHAHSHLMYFGWVTPSLMALIATRILERPFKASGTRARFPGGIIATSLILGLASYVPFFVWGYQPAEFAGARLPVAVIVASLNMLAWYAYIAWYVKIRRNLKPDASVQLWDAALVFMVLASLGAWGRAALVAIGNDDLFLSTAMIHLFLDLFSDGWFLLAMLGLAYAALPTGPRPGVWANRLLFAGLPLTFLLGIPVDLVPGYLRTLAGVGGLLAATGTAIHLRALWPALAMRQKLWQIPLAFLGVKIAFQAAASLAPLAVWGEQMGLRIFYLHVMLLGFVTLGVVAAIQDTWETLPAPALQALTWSVVALLTSLIPLTGVWPGALSGVWSITLAAWISLTPILAAIWLIIEGAKRHPTVAKSTRLKQAQP